MAMIGVMEDSKLHEDMENDMLGDLTSRAREALALFISISLRDNTELNLVVPNGPSWLSHVDKKDLYLNDETLKKITDILVAKDVTGNYNIVNVAIAAAPQHSQKRFVIYIKTSIYVEIVVIGNMKSNLTLIADGQDSTIITFNLSSSNSKRTFNTATFASNGDGFIRVDMCFRNTTWPVKGPVVTLRVNGDMSIIYRCRVEEYQDALYPHKNRQCYREYFLMDTVDFICGNAAAVFQFCQIVHMDG
ncbi:pectin methylesterase 7 [Arabidopsis thaliana]|uniref:Putative pectinesterase 57 n=1 Tax=Arabidopsis thaliana TaxID=3702 RepID=PME57_ARATH|nr:pectin methylesterase 7 [Arabidopsis thaliana]Q9MAL0.2 RecName: Full=Putative pectinesterase 57; Short=PE 57; AltName: Full=Pectin methylesterase 57; Short=AtPME57 [Arabidopsis thaliana]AEE32070.1 pectin methylesterase 7 [Arabidopsis thaliana]|eukprot:NP_175118.2 pectin methylesterase 7 [Arabidopsis thaliana]